MLNKKISKTKPKKQKGGDTSALKNILNNINGDIKSDLSDLIKSIDKIDDETKELNKLVANYRLLYNN